ncbi:predicted protein [Naegleria gruberi]|uniref:Predicted protein n=1 Tax=Naegleria gruberi TaxID=5762 RepID=D2VFK1_NAEGR|nr:uncharacterized protein NAEGRDRAFT_67654 [Naegleria gruberi]EFC44484.1 predicted protein [Naegleria gruberi]|eukprot:XP_002677228.1 predicted protein [Naegleria gruberi strain NEG-M]
MSALTEQELYQIVDSVLSDPSDVENRKRLAHPENGLEQIKQAYMYALDQYYSRSEQVCDDEAKTSLSYGFSLISLICFTSMYKSFSNCSSIDDIFDFMEVTKGLAICVEFCKAEKSVKAFRVLRSFLAVFTRIAKEGKHFRSIVHAYEIHQMMIDFFEGMGLIKNESSSSEDIQAEVEACFTLYMDSLCTLFSDSSFENIDDNFMMQYLLMCRGLFNHSFSNDNIQNVFIHLFTGIPSCVMAIQHYTESKRKQSETIMDVLKFVIVEICESLKKKSNVRKGITLLSAVATAYIDYLSGQKELILESLSNSVTRMLLMPRRSEVVQQMLNKTVELFLLIPFQNTSLEAYLSIKPASPDYLNAAAKTYLFSFLINSDKKYGKYIENVIKQIRYCDSILMLDISDSISLYQTILQNTLSAIVKNKDSQLLSDIQVTLWKELFDVSNNDIAREFCIDIIATLFNNNSGSQQPYLDYLKELIGVISHNLFLAPQELRLSNSQQGENVEWMVVEKILRPLLGKMDIKDHKQVTNFTDILSEEGISQLAILPCSIRVVELRKCITSIINKLKDRNDDPFSIALVILLKNVTQQGKLPAESCKKMITIILTNKLQSTVSDKYLEEAILCLRDQVSMPEIGSDFNFLNDILNNLKQICWARSDRIKVCICSLVESITRNKLSDEFTQTLQQFFKLAIESDNLSVQTIVSKSLLSIYLQRSEHSEMASNILGAEFIEFVEHLLSGKDEEGKVRAFSKLTDNSMVDLQNSKFEISKNKKIAVVSFQSEVQKLKSNIKSIQTVSIVDQLAEVNKSMNDLLQQKDKDPSLIQQLNSQIQELNNISSKLFK